MVNGSLSKGLDKLLIPSYKKAHTMVDICLLSS